MEAITKSKVKYRKILWVLAGVLVYGFFNAKLDFLLPGAEFITFRPQLIIPVGAALLLGPFYGGFIGLFGNIFGDFLLGYGFQFWHWSIGNFIIGFVPGIVRWLKIIEIKRVNEFGLVLLFIFLGNLVGLFEGFLVQVLLDGKGGIKDVLYSFYLPAVIANVYIMFLLMPPVLLLFKFLKLNIETRSMFFVLFFSLVIVTLLSFVFVGVQHNVFLGQFENNLLFRQMIIKDFRWIGLVLIIIVVAGGTIGYHFSKKYMQPINQLSGAANKIKNGDWGKDSRVGIEKVSSDMLNLIELFNEMAVEIRKRETNMNNIITELKMEIDEKKEDQMFAEITETDFFKKLEQKSKEIKKRKNDKI